MTKPLIQIGDEVREMTDAEHEQWLADGERLKAKQENAQAVVMSAHSKLKALGLTDTEINALFGQ